MNLTSEEDNKLFECPVCYFEYDLSTHIPKDLGCGHNLCSVCVNKLPRARKNRNCPLCKNSIRAAKEIPTNFTLLSIIERREKIKANLCTIHKRYEYDFYCFKDKVKVCIECKISEAHKDHDIRALDKMNEEALRKAQESEEMLRQVDRHEDDLQKLYSKTMQDIKTQIQEQFTTIQDQLSKDKTRLLTRVNKFFDNKMPNKESPGTLLTKNKLRERISILKSKQITDQFISHLQNDKLSLPLQSFTSEINTTLNRCNTLRDHLKIKLDDFKSSIFIGLGHLEPISINLKPSQYNSILEEWKQFEQISPPELPQKGSNQSDRQEGIYLHRAGYYVMKDENTCDVYLDEQHGKFYRFCGRPSYRDFPGYVMNYYKEIIYKTNVHPEVDEDDAHYFSRVFTLYSHQAEKRTTTNFPEKNPLM